MYSNLAIDVQTSLPVVTCNFEAAKIQLTSILKEYDVIVDSDGIKAAKKMATEINKLSKQIDTVRKEKVSELNAPIKEFDAEAKSLSSLCQESRQKLLSQVKVSEDKKIERAKTLLNDELNSVYSKYGVRAEFQNVKVLDLAIISNLNNSGLAKKAKDAIDERVLEAKKFQEKIDKRLLTLETICFKGGLQAPLTRKNIEHFLMIEDDDIYLEKLVSLIQNEIDRINAMKKREQEQTQTQNIQQVEEKKITPVTKPRTTSKYDKFKNNQFAPKSKNAKATFTVTAVFEVEFDESKAHLLKDMLLDKFAKSNFKSIPTVYVEKEEIRHAS